jgi:uncharacterized RDD family membrane protein YckC
MDTRVGFGPRLLAAVFDALAVGIAGLLLGTMLARGIGLPLAEAAGEGAGGAAAFAALIWTLAGLSVFVFLYSLIEAVTGASPGKMVLGLRVGREDGRQATRGIYARRWAVKFSGSLLGLLGAIPGIYVAGLLAPAAGLVVFAGCFFALGDKRQALHDLAAKTAVFRKVDLAP